MGVPPTRSVPGTGVLPAPAGVRRPAVPPGPVPTRPVPYLPTRPARTTHPSTVGAPAQLLAGRAFLIFFIYLVTQGDSGGLGGVILSLILPSADFATVTLAGGIVGVALGGLAIFMVTKESMSGGSIPQKMAVLGWRAVRRVEALKGAGLGLLLGVVGLPVLFSLFPPAQDVGEQTATGSVTGLLLYAVIAVLLAPPVEEFLFRGVVHTGMTTSWGPKKAAAGSTLLFTAVHIPGTLAYPPALLLITILGGLALFLRRRSGSLIPCIGLHAGYNLVVVTVSAIGLG